MPGLEWFKNVVFCCSYQDKYVPFDSARMQICKQAAQDAGGRGTDKMSRAYVEMVRNVFKGL